MSLLLLVGGLIFRWTAILTLGRFFTVNVAISDDHKIIESGLYRYLRHPSYTGLLQAFLGLGLAFRNWISLVILFLPIIPALLRRITVEERALSATFGVQYEEYCARTWRLLPWLY